MQIASVRNSSESGMMGGEPCDQSKPHNDICNSVRYRLLSIKTESLQSDRTLFSSTLPNAIGADHLLPVDALLSPLPFTTALDSLSKHSPRFSQIVLRI
jgi:hypothetical protein